MLPALCASAALLAAAGDPAFDAATINLIPPFTRHGGATRAVTPQSLTLHNASLGNCIFWAFGYEHWRVDGPEWRDYPTQVVYDITGKTDTPVPEAQLNRMLQTLLKDRLGLAYHLETRELPVYALIVDRGGPKFHASQSTGDPKIEAGQEAYEEVFRRFSMRDLARELDPPFTSRHTIDETGLAGIYDFTIDMRPYVLDPQGKPILNAIGAIDMENAYLAALPHQLGLRLLRKTAPLEVMVIDHIQKDPTGN